MKCANCGQELSAGSQFCIKCGTKTSQEQGVKEHFCTGCGAKLEPNSRFCLACGVSISGATTHAIVQKKKGSYLLWILLPLGFVLIAGGVIALVLITSKPQPSGANQNTTSKGTGLTPEETLENLKSAIKNEDFETILNMLYSDARKKLPQDKEELIARVSQARDGMIMISDEEQVLLNLSNSEIRKMSWSEILKYIHKNSPQFREKWNKIKIFKVTKIEPIDEKETIITYEVDERTKYIVLIKEDNKWHLESFLQY